jgi:hypothetical protein
MDQLMLQRQHIVRTYNLQEVRMVKKAPTVLQGAAGQAGKMEAQKIQEEPDSLSLSTHSEAHLVRASSASAVSTEAIPREVEHADAAASLFTATFAAFIREHEETAQFHLFRKANEPLTVLWNRWKSKAISCPGETAMQLPEWDQFETVRLLKGLLRVASFMSEHRAEPISRGHVQSAADADRMWKFEETSSPSSHIIYGDRPQQLSGAD